MISFRSPFSLSKTLVNSKKDNAMSDANKLVINDNFEFRLIKIHEVIKSGLANHVAPAQLQKKPAVPEISAANESTQW